jgi:WD40 repeat protein
MRPLRRWLVLIVLLVAGGLGSADKPGAPTALPAGCVARLPAGGEGEPVFSIAYSPDGKVLASAGYEPVVRLWAVATGKELRQLRGHTGAVRWAAFSPDGNLVATLGSDRTVRAWEAATGKERWSKAGHRFGGGGGAFSPDGKAVATVAGFGDPAVLLWVSATGQRLRDPLGDKERSSGAACVAFAPDGKSLAEGTVRGLVRIWAPDSGKLLFQFHTHEKGVAAVGFSPDGTLLASAGGDGLVRLWEPKREAEVRALRGHRGRAHCVVFSPDGGTLASAGEDHTVRLWETTTGKEVARWEGHADDVKAVAFAPGGREVASGGSDGVIFVWDVTGMGKAGRKGPGKHSTKELAALWADLAGASAAKAHHAIWALAGAGEQAVALLEKRLSQRPKEPASEASKRVADLASDKGEVRKTATERLRTLGWQAEPALHRALRSRPTLEVRQRVEALLEALWKTEMPADLVRELRAVRVLEQAGTAGGRRLLETLAKGDADERLTKASRAAVERLKQRVSMSSR